MEDRIVNTTDTVDNSIFNRIEEGDDADHQLMYLSIRTYIEKAINVIAEINYGPYPPVDAWGFYCDSDHAGNSEVQNRRRSQNGLIITHNDAPAFWQSKASSVAFATPHIGEAHADTSSGAVEIFAAGNATMDIISVSYPTEEHAPRAFGKCSCLRW